MIERYASNVITAKLWCAGSLKTIAQCHINSH